MTDADVADVASAVAAATATTEALGLAVDEAVVVHVSNRLALRLLPCDVLARVAPPTHGAAQLEVDLATRLARTDSPVAALDPRVAPRVYERDGYNITLWTYYEAPPASDLAPAAYALALSRLHAGLLDVDLPVPHVMDRVREAERLVASAARTPEFSEADRDLLATTFDTASRAVHERHAAEQLLHGEPHPGNVLATTSGPRFIDLETCCRGPLEFDLAHVPEAVSDLYADVDPDLLRQCRILVLAMVAAWRLDPEDRFPRGQEALRDVLSALRAGPPYPPLGDMAGLS